MAHRKFEKNIMTDFNTTKDQFGIYLYKLNEVKNRTPDGNTEPDWDFP